MGDDFIRKRELILEEMRAKDPTANVEDIPIFRVRTPLQSVIMILKRHRDIMFSDDMTDAPISIIISTLSAHAYTGEGTIGKALMGILARMDDTIEHDGENCIVRNPTDLTENFADKWQEHPERETAFRDWLEKAREHFSNTTRLTEHIRMSGVLEERMGRDVTKAASAEVIRRAQSSVLLGAATAASAVATPQVSFSDTPRTPKKPDGFA